MLPRLATTALIMMVVALSAASLQFYYSAPKQAYRASIGYLEDTRTNNEPVIVVDLAEQGYRYYGNRLGARLEQDYFFVQSEADLDAVLAANSEESSYVATTLPRFLHLRNLSLRPEFSETGK